MEGSSTGGSHCRRPFEAKQRRHRRSMPSKTGSQPALPASPLSSSPQFLPLPRCCVSRILKVHFSSVFIRFSLDAIQDGFELPLQGRPILLPQNCTYFSDISLRRCISQILKSVFLKFFKAYFSDSLSMKLPPANNLPPGTSRIHPALFLTGPSCFSR